MLGLFDAVDDVLVQPFVPDRADVALDVSVLLRLAWLDVRQGDAVLFSPIQQRGTDLFRAVIHADGLGLALPLDDVVQAAGDPLCRQGKVHLDAQTFAVEVVQHVQQPERAAVLKPIGHEIHGPWSYSAAQARPEHPAPPSSTASRLDPQVQLQGAVDPIDALVV